MDNGQLGRTVTSRIRRGWTVALATTVAFGMTACEDDDPSSSLEGEGTVTASVTDDPQSGGGSSGLEVGADQVFTGTYSGQTQIEVFSDADGWVTLGAPTATALALQSSGGTTQVASSSTIDAGSYSRVRIRMTGPSLTLDAGSDIDGLILTVSTDLQIGTGGEVVIEKTVTPFTVTANSTTDITFDFNAEAVVDQATVQSGTVTEASLASATTVQVN